MKIDIQFTPEYKNVPPKIKIGDKSFVIKNKQTVSIDLPFKEKDQLIVEFINKDDNDDNCINIGSVHIDEINLQHFIFLGKFYPEYNQDWYSKQNPKPPEYYCPGTAMRHNGSWKLDVVTPIFKMILNEWLKDER